MPLHYITLHRNCELLLSVVEPTPRDEYPSTITTRTINGIIPPDVSPLIPPFSSSLLLPFIFFIFTPSFLLIYLYPFIPFYNHSVKYKRVWLLDLRGVNRTLTPGDYNFLSRFLLSLKLIVVSTPVPIRVSSWTRKPTPRDEHVRTERSTNQPQKNRSFQTESLLPNPLTIRREPQDSPVVYTSCSNTFTNLTFTIILYQGDSLPIFETPRYGPSYIGCV